MINKKLSEIEISDIQNLIDNGIPEGKTIDYKVTYSLTNEREKGELLADISSFANTSGGDLIFGIKEEGGVASEIIGVNLADKDEEKQKIENLLRDGIEPRIDIDFHFVQVEGDKEIMVIRVKQSYLGPHRVIFNQYPKTKDQFYARNSSGKFQLDTRQLREAFVQSDSVSDRIRKFRDDRMIRILSGEFPSEGTNQPKLIIHIIPIQAFSTGLETNLQFPESTSLGPIYSSGWNFNRNIDGWITYSGRRDDPYKTYTQVYRNGIIEVVDRNLLGFLHDEIPTIPTLDFESRIRKYIPTCIDFLVGKGINYPFSIFISLTGVEGFNLGVNLNWDNHNDTHLTRDIVNFPEIYLDGPSDSLDSKLIPIFDILWNAFGYPRSFNYTEDGRWRYNDSGNLLF